MKKYFLLVGFVITSGWVMAQSGRLVAEKSGKGAVLVHQVQPKEGLYSISRAYGVKVADIAAANGFDKDKGLSIGQKIKIPLTAENLSKRKGKTPVYYEVSAKETLTSISSRFNKVSVKDLKSWNKISGDAIGREKSIIVGYFDGAAPAAAAEKETDQKGNTAKTGTKAMGQALVKGTNINIRKGPATDQSVVGTARQDEVLDILKKVDDEWAWVRTKDGVEGFVASQFLETIERKAEAKPTRTAAKAIGTATVSGTNINIRKGPATDQEVIGVAQQDEIVDVLKKVNSEWTSIRTKDGTEGFVASQFLVTGDKKAAAKPEAPVVVKAIGKATVSGTNINIRKGAATDQEVVGVAQQDEEVEVLKNVNSEWTSIRTKDGVEGFVASRFLQAGGKKAEPAKAVAATKTATAYGTRINIRKGPATDQEVIGMAQAEEVLTYIRKVNDEWSEVRNADGSVTGFVATRFLSFDGQPSVAAVEAEALAKSQAEANKAAEEAAAAERAVADARKREEDQKAESLVSEKITARNDAETSTPDEAGYFKADYLKMVNPNLAYEKTFASGIFKTDRGWNDGKYYLLMDNAAPGSLVKLTNPANNKVVYAKVLGKMKGIQYSEGFDIRISEAAAQKLQIGNTDKFNVTVTY
ncbi:SH3 domain-containing protein [Niabella yanshanensis]|uniref:SH3 domain-containing protein n=1 Tax=Niabella yanshanensis TaxID=577386 RepID=A0ABZ0W9C1_9BACT|nr:SH3 domain-containing protein [Niabella yanshanensis]WQD38666.1 SH3 domain-containing protein [Niabella yanshanensis]